MICLVDSTKNKAMENKILVLFAHPALEKSRINKFLIEGMNEVKDITFHDLYQRYPELDIDIEYEQNLLKKHNIIVFHHPFYWYSTPAIIKEWQDLVLTHGWAYGSQGNALKGKYLFNVVTTGATKDAYTDGGHNNFSMKQFFAPLEQTANLCKMIYLPPFTIHGTLSISKEELSMQKTQLLNLYERMINNELDLEKSKSLERINTLGK